MKYLLVILVFLALLTAITLALQFMFNKKILLERRLQRLQDSDEEVEKKNRVNPLKNLVSAIFIRLNKWIYNLMPKTIKEKINMKLQRAGIIQKIDVNKWIMIKIVVSVMLPALYLLIIYKETGFTVKNMFMFIVVWVILYFMPNLFVEKLIVKRKLQIQRELPDVLDLLTVSVEAGLSFDNSILKLTDKMNGVVISEFEKVIAEMRMGKTRKEALEDMQKRLDVDDITTFIGALVQAHELGISISNVIKIQSKQMRQKRRQRAQEIAMKAPVKMLFPLVFFIFPSIFIILLGPAVIKIIETFRG